MSSLPPPAVLVGGTGVFVGVGVFVLVGMAVLVGVDVDVLVEVGIDVAVGVGVATSGTSAMQTAVELTRSFALERRSRANVVLHVLRSGWPFALDTARAPALVAAVDLADSPDQRTARAGREYLAGHRG